MEKRSKIAYLELDSSYFFIESTNLERKIIKALNKKNEELNNNIDSKNSKLDSITYKYFDSHLPERKEIDNDNFLLSLSLSKYFCKKRNIKKDTIEIYINFLFYRRNKINRTNSFTMRTDIMENLGNILSYSFSKLETYKIKNKKQLLEKVKQNEVNILTEFYQFCNDNNLNPVDANKTKFWYRKNKKFELPPELIFLINLFSTITFFDFDINFLTKSFNDDNLKYFMLVLMNLDLFLLNIEHIKFNLIHENYQESFNSLDEERVKNAIYPDPLKINYSNDNDNLYSKKWDFKHNFMLEEYRKIENIKKKEKKLEKIEKSKIREFCDFTILSTEDESFVNPSNPQSVRTGIPNNLSNSLTFSTIYRSNRNNTFYYSKQQTFSLKSFTNNQDKKANNEIIKGQINDLFIKNRYCFEIMFILFYALKIYKEGMSIDLIMNYSYNSEIIRIFEEIYRIDIKQEDNDFHIIDLFSNSLKTANSLNVEIDSFDLIIVERLLNAIFSNKTIQKLKLSFFTTDINYFPHKLLRIYIYSLNKLYNSKNNKLYDNIILSEFYPFFKNNLLYLFYLIRRRPINSLGLNFDIPILVQQRTKYMMTILKFLLNILIFLNDPDCNIKDLTLLSPNTILDGRTMNNIDKIFEEMFINKKKKTLIELNLQFTIYEIPHITNVVISNLVILRIGNLDLITFEALTNHLNSFSFAGKSSLRQLNIKLMNSIEYLSPRIKIILREFFTIKLRFLRSLCLCTNIIIKDQKECTFLAKILSDNWIPSYTLLFNEQSQELLNQYLKEDKITFLVPHNLERDLIGINKNNNISTIPDDMVYWYLKYLFNNRYYYSTRNFRSHKYYIYNILKYLYYEKNIKISYEIKEEL